MVHYVRFLKTPRITHVKGPFITALITITTDLGEAFLGADIDLAICLISAFNEKVLRRRNVSWKSSFRDLSIGLDCSGLDLSNQECRLWVHSLKDVLPLDHLQSFAIPPVLDAWSAPFGRDHGLIAAAFVQRRFELDNGGLLKIWEETGNSIALHVWDAAIGMLTLMHHHEQGEGFRSYVKTLSDDTGRPLRVVELGTGCGIVGIAMSSLIESADILLTDLPEAVELAKKNINETVDLVPRPSLRHIAFNWEDEVPRDLRSNVDMVLVSDCTYNSDAIPSLVNTLVKISAESPTVRILVTMKRRHDSEEIFFDLIGRAFQSMTNWRLFLPHIATEYDRNEPFVEVYVYERRH